MQPREVLRWAVTRRSGQAVLALVLAFAVVIGPASAQMGLGNGLQAQENVPACLEETIEESGVDSPAALLNEHVPDDVNDLPSVVRRQIAGERVSIHIGAHRYGLVVHDDGTMGDVSTGELKNPTLIAKSSCGTIKEIIEFEVPMAELGAAAGDGRITFHGVDGNGQSDVKAKGLQKALQIPSIATPAKKDSIPDITTSVEKTTYNWLPMTTGHVYSTTQGYLWVMLDWFEPDETE